MCDRGACGECELFGNDLRILDGNLHEAFTFIDDGEDETEVCATAWCPEAVEFGDPEFHDPRAGYIAEDTPACPRKVEPPDAELYGTEVRDG